MTTRPAIAEAPVSSGIALGLAGVLPALGFGFTAKPKLGAAAFGLPRQDAEALPYVRALGLHSLSAGG